MKNIKTLTLIDGNFTNEEAHEILTNMFASKINFHTLKNWSSHERYGKVDVIEQNRIPALKNEMKKLEEILLEAKNHNKKLIVSSDIHITLVDE